MNINICKDEYYQKVLEYSNGDDFWLKKDYMRVMNWADYRRQEHNRKKCEKEQSEKEEQKQKEKAALRENWKLLLVGALMQILAIVFVVFLTAKTGHPGFALTAWWMAIWTLFGYCKRHKPKIFKWLPVIPIVEFLIFVVLTIYTLVTNKWAIGHIDLGLISLCAFFSSIINGVMYLGVKFKGYIFKKRENISMLDYISKKRVENAKKMLVTTEMNLETIALQCGFTNIRTFMRVFQKYEIVTPGKYKELNKK